MKLSEKNLKEIYGILINVCDAPADEHAKQHFLYNQLHEDFPREWRFQGNLGFGGKFWRTPDRIYVNCYPEDETPERFDVICKANELLLNLAIRINNK